MKLASLKAGGRDGTLIVVDRTLRRAVAVPDIALTLQRAIDEWAGIAPRLKGVYERLNGGGMPGELPFNTALLAAPLPRAYQWLDASAYLPHVELGRKARRAPLPPNLRTDPLMYQGASDCFLGPCEPVRFPAEEWGIDFEAELAVVTDDVPMGVSAAEAGAHIKLFMLVNDVSLRELIPGELAKGFGFVHGKPASSFSPVAITPDELGNAWDGARVHVPMLTRLNGADFGCPDAGRDMAFGFPELIGHAARTRTLGAGTIIGSGTVSNADASRGASCILERRMRETLEQGAAVTSYLRFDDQVRIEMLGADGESLFGAIEQRVELLKNA